MAVGKIVDLPNGLRVDFSDLVSTLEKLVQAKDTAKIEYDLSDPDSKARFTRANKADNLFSAVWEFDQWLRSQIKYCHKNDYHSVRDKLYELLKDADINLEELWS
jgi:hypothetical protein